MSDDFPKYDPQNEVLSLGRDQKIGAQPVSIRHFVATAAAVLVLILGGFAAYRYFALQDGCASGSPCVNLKLGKVALEDLPGRPEDDLVVSASVEKPLSPEEMDLARAKNAKVPFVSGKLTPALPFRFLGTDADRAVARECLALAMLYEAGPDDRGQRAVAQVILNRVRHPAYPSSICGVVFQGHQRKTGCQFTFTCDGALRRRQPEDWLASARRRAGEAIAGSVFAEVGLATHYHTDWVYPYWSPSLEKLARIDTHLFFRWPGYWGSRAAYSKPHAGKEAMPLLSDNKDELVDGVESPADTQVDAALLGPDGTPAIPLPPARTALALPTGVSEAALRGSKLMLMHPDGDAYGLQLDPQDSAETYLGVALRLCRSATFCHVMGWRDTAAIPAGFPVSPAARQRMSFSYMRDKDKGREEVRFDCALFPRSDATQCL